MFVSARLNGASGVVVTWPGLAPLGLGRAFPSGKGGMRLGLKKKQGGPSRPGFGVWGLSLRISVCYTHHSSTGPLGVYREFCAFLFRRYCLNNASTADNRSFRLDSRKICLLIGRKTCFRRDFGHAGHHRRHFHRRPQCDYRADHRNTQRNYPCPAHHHFHHLAHRSRGGYLQAQQICLRVGKVGSSYTLLVSPQAPQQMCAQFSAPLQQGLRLKSMGVLVVDHPIEMRQFSILNEPLVMQMRIRLEHCFHCN